MSDGLRDLDETIESLMDERHVLRQQLEALVREWREREGIRFGQDPYAMCADDLERVLNGGEDE